MDIRAIAVSALVSVSVCSTLGCSPQSTSPSGLSAPSSVSTAAVSGTSAAISASRFGSRTPGVVYVTSQGLYYDTFVVKDPLPMEGPFQRLANGQTEFGPGQSGYLGGRWWVDENGNGSRMQPITSSCVRSFRRDGGRPRSTGRLLEAYGGSEADTVYAFVA